MDSTVKDRRRKLADARAAGAGPIVRFSATCERAIAMAGAIHEHPQRGRDASGKYDSRPVATPESRAAVGHASIDVGHLLYQINDYLASYMDDDVRAAFEALHAAQMEFCVAAKAHKYHGKGVD
tara:strand:+ start:673 stop:1044 length:372 start_codon:yes stop_codon:yes gene_type:complete